MGLDSKRTTTLLGIFAAILLAILLRAYWHRASEKRSQSIHRATMANLCASERQMLIGLRPREAASAYIDPCNADVNHNLLTARTLSGYRVFEYESNLAPDNSASFKVDGGVARFLFSDTADNFSISLQRPMTPLRWSPNGDLAFYVGKSTSSSSLPLKECLDDTYLIHAIDVRDRSDDVVSKVCAGFPYTSLRWLQR
jgi:hypothetical protein